ncbi:hypothetical protein C8Q77DRAFT_1213745 [Trametes polyzona]|nr:hypothetical protein C8Q77DRAFT_1213745 [Trametes polyzona]
MSNKQRLVLSIIDFLNQSIQDGTVKQDDKESLEVAIQCIGEAFGVDPTDQAQVDRLSVKPANLLSIFDVFLKTKDKLASPAGAAAPASATPSKSSTPSASDKAAAEKHKATGNAHMSAKKYDDAIKAYTEAIALDATNPVYYSNRAAAYSSKGEHSSAVLDAEKAIEVDSSFVKAYHRLGHAHYSLGDFKEAAAAFRRGLEVDPNNASLKSGLQNAEARIVPDDDTYDDMPPLDPAPARGAGAGGNADAGAGAGGMAGMAEMLRNMGMGGGGGGGAGGMPDLASLMNNPMMMQMAQQMMQNGGLERLMQNPSVANMMNRMQSGGGMPSMSELMSDPTLRDLAGQFGAGGAGGGAGGR